MHNRLSVLVAEEVSRTANLLATLDRYQEEANLKQFREDFYQRYGQQEVPLMQALDVEMGLGYPVTHLPSTDHNPLLADLPLGEGVAGLPSYAWSAWQQFVFNKYVSAIQQNELILTLHDQELAPFVAPTLLLPHSMYAAVSVLSTSFQAVDQGNFELIH